MVPVEKFEAALGAARAAWEAEQRQTTRKVQALLRDGRDVEALLRKCRPFVWRAMQGGKLPRAQDKVDAEALWPQIKDLGGA